MSVPNQTPYIIYNANGLTTVFPFEFYIISASDVQVTLNGEIVTSGYSVSGVGNVAGGDVVFLSPPASGTVVMLERVVPTYRLTEYQDNGDLLADTVNKDFDRLWMAIQRSFIYLGLALRRPLLGGPFDAQGYRISKGGDPVDKQDFATKNYVDNVSLVRALRVPEAFVSPLPAIEQRKNKIVAMDNSGNPLMVLPESGSAADVMIELAKPTGAGGIGTTSGQTVQQELDQMEQNAEELSSHIQKNELINFGSTNSINSWRSNEGVIKGRKVNILGDSISFGAGAGNDINSSIPENSWVRILGSALNKKYGVDSYGFVSPYASNGTGTEIHGVAISPSGSWAGYAGQEAGHTPAGMYQESSTPSSYFAFNLAGLISTHFVIWYDASVTGSFQIVLNADVANPVASITTNGSGVGLEKTTAYACASVPAGGVQIRIVNVSGTVRVTGISYVNEQTGLEYSLNNFSRDGRAGRWMTETAIKEMCMGTMSLIYCLGANDRSATGSDLDAFKQRINWLIQYCNAYGTRLIVCDFLFINNDDHPIRVELKRLSESVNGATLIPFPNLLSTNGEVNTSAYLINTINFSYDGVHLSVIGHRIVAEVIGRCLGVEASKLSHLSNNTRWRPVVLSAGVNSGTTFGTVSKYRIVSGIIELDLQIPMPSPGTKVANISLPNNFGASLRSGNYISNPDSSGRTCIIGISATGDVTIYSNASSSAPPTAVSAIVRIPMVSQMKFN